MIAGFPHRVVQVVKLDDVTAPRTVSDAYARPRHVVDQVVAYGNTFGPRDIDPGNLLPKHPAIVDQVVGGLALIRKVSLCAVCRFK